MCLKVKKKEKKKFINKCVDVEFFLTIATSARGKQAVCDHHLCHAAHTLSSKMEIIYWR